MTCIVGLVDEGSVYLGADSAGSTDDFTSSRIEPKAFKVGEFGFAYTSSFRMGDILHYSFTPPVFFPDEISIEKYMRTLFVDEIRTTFEAKGFGKSNGDSGDIGGDFMVAFKGRLFAVLNDYQIGEYHTNYYADGSGAYYALGSLFSTNKQEPKIRVRLALKAAAKFSPSVSSPFTIIKI